MQNNYYQTPQYRIGLKGRPVSSLEEVRATPVDFDGSISYFPNLANDIIYTKQINPDGTSALKAFALTELPQESPAQGLVTKEEFSKTISELEQKISSLTSKKSTTKSSQQEFKF